MAGDAFDANPYRAPAHPTPATGSTRGVLTRTTRFVIWMALAPLLIALPWAAVSTLHLPPDVVFAGFVAALIVLGPLWILWPELRDGGLRVIGYSRFLLIGFAGFAAACLGAFGYLLIAALASLVVSALLAAL